MLYIYTCPHLHICIDIIYIYIYNIDVIYKDVAAPAAVVLAAHQPEPLLALGARPHGLVGYPHTCLD